MSKDRPSRAPRETDQCCLWVRIPPLQEVYGLATHLHEANNKSKKETDQLTSLVKKLVNRTNGNTGKTKKSQKSGRRANSSRSAEFAGAQVALPMMQVTNTSQKSERVRGSDYIDSYHVNSAEGGWQPDTVVATIVVTPDMTERLESTARRYQRIRWNSLRFKIDGGFSTLSSGQYAVAFIRDPTDSPTSASSAIRWVTAQQGSRIAKWWQPTTIQVPSCPDLLWTSQQTTEGTGLRFSSPGQLVLVCVNPPAQPGSITLWLDWDVTVSEPSIETDLSGKALVNSITMLRDAALTWYPGDGTYASLRATHPPSSFDPALHELTERPLIDLSLWGFGTVDVGDYLYADHPITFMAQFTSGTGKTESLVSTHLWKCDMKRTEQDSVERKCLTPMCRFLKADSSGYDIEYAGYVNSTGSGAYTWADTYSGIVVLPAGTKFAKMDPQSHYEPEEVTTYYRGKRVTRPTGRMIKASIPSYNVSEYYPTVNTGANNGAVSNVVVVNSQPIPVQVSGDPAVAGIASTLATIETNTVSSLAVELDMKTTLNDILEKEPPTHVTADIAGLITYDRDGDLVVKPIAAMHNETDAGESFTLTAANIQPVAPYNISSTWHLNPTETASTRMATVVNSGNVNELCVNK